MIKFILYIIALIGMFSAVIMAVINSICGGDTLVSIKFILYAIFIYLFD